jgi:hypothetical protein
MRRHAGIRNLSSLFRFPCFRRVPRERDSRSVRVRLTRRGAKGGGLGAVVRPRCDSWSTRIDEDQRGEARAFRQRSSPWREDARADPRRRSLPRNADYFRLLPRPRGRRALLGDLVDSCAHAHQRARARARVSPRSFVKFRAGHFFIYEPPSQPRTRAPGAFSITRIGNADSLIDAANYTRLLFF